jgi:hypothetical protein
MTDNKIKSRAKIRILSHITQFSLATILPGNQHHRCLSDMGFRNDLTNETVRIGDLVALQSAPSSKWYLSWLNAIEKSDRSSFEHRYLLESIEDGEECWWCNVSFLYYSREDLEHHPEWRWTDAQFQLNDRWTRTCLKEKDSYRFKPDRLKFEGSDVRLRIRQHIWYTGPGNERAIGPWKKLTIASMKRIYNEMVQQLKDEEETLSV